MDSQLYRLGFKTALGLRMAVFYASFFHRDLNFVDADQRLFPCQRKFFGESAIPTGFKTAHGLRLALFCRLCSSKFTESQPYQQVLKQHTGSVLQFPKFHWVIVRFVV